MFGRWVPKFDPRVLGLVLGYLHLVPVFLVPKFGPWVPKFGLRGPRFGPCAPRFGPYVPKFGLWIQVWTLGL